MYIYNYILRCAETKSAIAVRLPYGNWSYGRSYGEVLWRFYGGLMTTLMVKHYGEIDWVGGTTSRHL